MCPSGVCGINGATTADAVLAGLTTAFPPTYHLLATLIRDGTSPRTGVKESDVWPHVVGLHLSALWAADKCLEQHRANPNGGFRLDPVLHAAVTDITAMLGRIHRLLTGPAVWRPASLLQTLLTGRQCRQESLPHVNATGTDASLLRLRIELLTISAAAKAFLEERDKSRLK